MKFRKKPLVIEAERFNASNRPLPFSGRGDPCCYDGKNWYVITLEGTLNISDGSWIIKGIKGEFYPCEPDIFEKTYEEVL